MVISPSIFHLLCRNLPIAVSEAKGFEKLGEEQTADIDTCKLTRCIVVLDESQYIVNAEGNPEMTQAAQTEYDDFVVKLRQEFIKNDITILDEGYGADEDELESGL